MLRRKTPSLGFETLEQKQLLAGDVVASVVHGNLILRGDDASNQIAVTSGDAPGSYLIRGLNGTIVRMGDGGPPTDDPGGETPAAGAAPETGLVVEGVRRHVHIQMGDGDDVVHIHNAQFRRGLSFAGGADNDRLHVGARPDDPGPAPTATDGELAEHDNGPRDQANVGIRGSLRVRAGSGDDVVQIGTSPNSTGDDEATDGDRRHRPASVAVSGAVNVVLGEGNDAADIENTAARRAVRVAGGLGDDVVELEGVRAHLGRVATGDGADRVTVTDSAFRSLAIGLGGDDDTLTVAATSAARAWFSGGEGDADELVNGGENRFGRLRVGGFEIPDDANSGGDADGTRPPSEPGDGPGGRVGRLADALRRLRMRLAV